MSHRHGHHGHNEHDCCDDGQLDEIISLLKQMLDVETQILNSITTVGSDNDAVTLGASLGVPQEKP